MPRWWIYSAALIALLVGIWAGSLVKNDANDVNSRTTDIKSLSHTLLTDLDGQKRDLNHWSGHLRLINFWATWCIPCRFEMPLFQEIYKKYRGQGLEIIGIALDQVEPVKNFKEDLGIEYPILISDAQKGMELMSSYGNPVGVVPHSVLLSESGEVLDSHLGPFDESQLNQWIAPHLKLD